MQFDDDLDARGLLCPLPVLRLRKRLRALSPGQVIRVTADDPAAIVDIPHFCTEGGHAYLGSTGTDRSRIYYVRKSG